MQIRKAFCTYLNCEKGCPSEVEEAFIVSQDDVNPECHKNRKSFFAGPYFSLRCYMQIRKTFCTHTISEKGCPSEVKEAFAISQDKGNPECHKNRKLFFAGSYFPLRCCMQIRIVFSTYLICECVAQAKF